MWNGIDERINKNSCIEWHFLHIRPRSRLERLQGRQALREVESFLPAPFVCVKRWTRPLPSFYLWNCDKLVYYVTSPASLKWITNRSVITLTFFKYRARTSYNRALYFVYRYPSGQRNNQVSGAFRFLFNRACLCPRRPWRMIWGSVVDGGKCDSICFKSKSKLATMSLVYFVSVCYRYRDKELFWAYGQTTEGISTSTFKVRFYEMHLKARSKKQNSIMFVRAGKWGLPTGTSRLLEMRPVMNCAKKGQFTIRYTR